MPPIHLSSQNKAEILSFFCSQGKHWLGMAAALRLEWVFLGVFKVKRPLAQSRQAKQAIYLIAFDANPGWKVAATAAGKGPEQPCNPLSRRVMCGMNVLRGDFLTHNQSVRMEIICTR
jgi:hypothetical protein